jgi:polysaccharide biosynthesis transport protein
MEALISYAAHDAGLQQAADVTPWAVRHTFISYLVRQGLRFSDLARIVGTLPPQRSRRRTALSCPPGPAAPSTRPIELFPRSGSLPILSKTTRRELIRRTRIASFSPHTQHWH